MPPITSNSTPASTMDRDRAKKTARVLARMLQGTMALEGQGLPKPTLGRIRLKMERQLLRH